jgi:hypothetical protein
VFGEFQLVVQRGPGGRVIDAVKSREYLEEQLQRRYPNQTNLLEKPGCYVFAIRTGGRGRRNGHYTPWYVGKAKKQALLKECLGKHQLDHYHRALTRYARCTPVIFWIAKTARGQKKAVDARLLSQMEAKLIEYAYGCNPELCNTHRIPKLSFVIQGVRLVGQEPQRAGGRPSSAAGTFSRMLKAA